MKTFRILLLIGLTMLIANLAFALPSGPNNITELSSSRYNYSSVGGIVDAVAGNVTELSINATSITQTWQGYYGNITGKIVLGNAKNQSMYDWDITTASGQIYASKNSTIAWSEINCSNSTQIIEEDTNLGSLGKGDSVSSTFSQKNHNPFYVGTSYLSTNQCNSTNLKDANGYSANWQEVLLSDSSGRMIYTSIINGKTLGFDGSTYDFQMIVGEDGHQGDADTTPYYFWIELQ